MYKKINYTSKRVNCRKCNYFYVTWDAKSPYGCKALGFKTPNMPSSDVFNNSGIECLKFLPKSNKF
ncbi:MAG: uracil-DNA glycosylase [Ignavibacteriae bacterium]|nr:uracil-DNA glycosylase [Ignavibacteriota bacterium]